MRRSPSPALREKVASIASRMRVRRERAIDLAGGAPLTLIGANLSLPLARLAGEGGARRPCDGRVRVGAPSVPHEFGTAGAPTLTRLAPARHPLPPSGRGFPCLKLAPMTPTLSPQWGGEGVKGSGAKVSLSALRGGGESQGGSRRRTALCHLFGCLARVRPPTLGSAPSAPLRPGAPPLLHRRGNRRRGRAWSRGGPGSFLRCCPC